MSTPPRSIAVASGKGGVGKTWLSIALAAAFARTGRSVLLVDCDLGLANVDVQLGLPPSRDLGDVIAGVATIREIAVRHETGGFDVAAGRAGSGSLASLPDASIACLIDALERASGYDEVILDLGAGVDAAVRRLASWADTTLVVATGEPTSLTDAYVVIKLLVQDRARDPGVDVRVVVNQAIGEAAGRQTFATLERVSTSFLAHRPRLAGIVRRDDRVREAICVQVPSLLCFPASASSRDVLRLAGSLLRPGIPAAADAKASPPAIARPAAREPTMRRRDQVS